ncbi:GNAT family N-acetyltransferase [Aliidiomarina haloalkalitolerans]|uniref:GNAT family N-acetyltransferase n=1 Tax=Aliidiomarina haloalkalitolerans TaxID=859059 RepID=A0A432VW01_9GAMM|nr:GNAT family N-acetyltransferase [Aliidiomarina haloalkalitolerans]RUO20780.1 GNAT family N-acetyltransferase [Aliidiomarina haloalkalitolerans]
MKLVLPSQEFEQSYRSYTQELGDEVRYPFPLDFDDTDFAKLLLRIDNFRLGQSLPAGYVPSTTFWLVEGSEIVGVSNLRHSLNDQIRHAGGHIGLGIRPSKRGQGLGITLLRLTLEQAYTLGITDVHVHCYKRNEPSARMILACGGRLDSEVVAGDEVVQRYVVRR